ncbi:hypothetical protein Belba_2246 [Belliella baltica DSM 15883]|uniref:Curli production assembly/transport component CsgE n=1 Tax=Belliella baltica (strain DSM 15883 / CIP 108006 / LMG 21964 / BA134) TaxID=866536 RepID=I3Z6E4_BELBD|nr:hypothetical protein [Belliella baltica]AFL84812.1 hypothetical protein Belba_2246 [Belliella baltica DSM 15883]
MKNLLLTIFLFSFFSLGFAKNPNEKTFLIIFDKVELKNNRTSPEYIELSLMNLFETKSYSGNSDAAIILKTTQDKIDRCLLGDHIVRVNQTTITTLNDVAFQIIDLEQSKGVYQAFLSSIESKIEKSSKKSSNFFLNQLQTLKVRSRIVF